MILKSRTKLFIFMVHIFKRAMKWNRFVLNSQFREGSLTFLRTDFISVKIQNHPLHPKSQFHVSNVRATYLARNGGSNFLPSIFLLQVKPPVTATTPPIGKYSQKVPEVGYHRSATVLLVCCTNTKRY